MPMRADRRFYAILSLAACALMDIAPGYADMIDTSSMKTWEHCALCHSADGISRMAKFPKLAAQRPAYIEKQLREFRAEQRTNDGGPMVTNAGLLSDAQIIEVASYFGSLPPPPPEESETDTAVLATGRRLFEMGKPEAGVAACMSCHVGGGIPGVIAPAITAQHADYLRKQLVDFRDKARDNDPDGIMRAIAGALSEAEIEAVAVYAAARKRREGGAP
jgi:cytochrome c553